MPIRKIGDTWYADINFKGKRYRKRLSTNRVTAQKIHDIIVKENDFSVFGATDADYDFAQLSEQFLAESTPRVSNQTANDYRVLLERVAQHLQSTPINKTREKLNNYLLQRQKEGLSTRSLNLIIELTRRVFRHGIDTGTITADPVSSLRKFKSAKKLRRALLPNEIKALLDNSGKFRIIWLTFLGTGLRRSELV